MHRDSVSHFSKCRVKYARICYYAALLEKKLSIARVCHHAKDVG